MRNRTSDFDRDFRGFGIAFIVVWAIGALISLGVLGFGIWVLYQLVTWVVAQ